MDDERLGPALAKALARVFDLVVVADADGRIVAINPFGVEVFGHDDASALIGTPMLELMHPDDVERVLVAMARMLDTDAQVPGRPALVRIRRADGTYVRIEANGASGEVEVDGELLSYLLVIARPTTDADLHEHLMTLLTTGAPSEKSFELVPELGAWRQPNLINAVFVLDDDGLPLAFGSDLLLELGGLDDPTAPWADAVRTGVELFAATDELAPPAREACRARGITYLRARPVLDVLHRTNALVVIAHDVTSPLPAERSTLEFAWMAMDKMAMVLEMTLAWRSQAVELRRAAATDPLTGLANRAGFWSRYRDAAGRNATDSISVLCVDLDQFKPVNDSFGHAVGDTLLVEVADRLQRIVRPGDLIARLGGDEFAVVVHDLDGPQVSTVADRIIAALCEPFTIDGLDIRIGASIGIADAAASEFAPDALLDAADRALYEAKHGGRQRWVRANRD